MLALKKIAVTGGLACGKSSVCRFFKELGAEVVDADEIVHHLLATDVDLQRLLIAELGEEIAVDGILSRQRIAEKVFRNPTQLTRLEELLHPAVHQEVERRAEQAESSLFVAEVPLLFESEVAAGYDRVIVVVADEAECQKRFSGSAFEERMSRQFPLEEKRAKADFVIDNLGSLEELKQKTLEVYKEII